MFIRSGQKSVCGIKVSALVSAPSAPVLTSIKWLKLLLHKGCPHRPHLLASFKSFGKNKSGITKIDKKVRTGQDTRVTIPAIYGFRGVLT